MRTRPTLPSNEYGGRSRIKSYSSGVIGGGRLLSLASDVDKAMVCAEPQDTLIIRFPCSAVTMRGLGIADIVPSPNWPWNKNKKTRTNRVNKMLSRIINYILVSNAAMLAHLIIVAPGEHLAHITASHAMQRSGGNGHNLLALQGRHLLRPSHMIHRAVAQPMIVPFAPCVNSAGPRQCHRELRAALHFDHAQSR